MSVYFFSQHGLKNPRILYALFALKFSVARSFQKAIMVVSFAKETNVPDILNPLLSLLKLVLHKLPYLLYHVGAVSFFLSVTHSSLGVKNRHFPLSCLRRYTIDSSCFSAHATFFRSCMGRLELLVEPTIVSFMLQNHKLAVKRLIT